MSKVKEDYRFKMEQSSSLNNGSKPRKTPKEIKRHLRVRFKDSKKKSSVIEEEAKLDYESSAEKPRKTPDEIKRHLRVKFTSSKKSMAEQKDPEFGIPLASARLFLCVSGETRFARKWRNSIFYHETRFFPPKTRISGNFEQILHYTQFFLDRQS